MTHTLPSTSPASYDDDAAKGALRLSFASAQADLDAAVTRIGDAVAGLA